MRKGYGRDRIPKENPFWTLAKSLTNTWGGDDPDNTIFPYPHHPQR